MTSLGPKYMLHGAFGVSPVGVDGGGLVCANGHARPVGIQHNRYTHA